MHAKIAQLIFLPTYAWNLLLGRILKFRHWWDEVEPGVLLGARPLQCDVKPLFDAGVRGVVNMCDEYRGPIKEYERLGVEQQWLRTIDFQPPSLQHIHDGVEFIQRTLDANKKVYVHCKAGRGRSATIVLCWLVKYRKMTAKQAQAALLAKRPHVKSDLDQREVVKEYEQAVLASRKNTDGS